ISCANSFKLVASNYDRIENNSSPSSRRSSYVASLNRIRIQQSFKASNKQFSKDLGRSIFKRSSLIRNEFRSFLADLPEDIFEKLSLAIFVVLSESVENINDMDKVINAVAKSFGEQFVELYHLGFRPDYFAVIADAAIAECVKLDGGMHKRCETTLAWSQLIAIIFTGVRDGYYARLRKFRRGSYGKR
ncbi:unnamed protein product, partial [Dracunculus medinensis]|uniref:GLOBIN domain-containing protein n=1 Tax=Dracunculus medinensis TaxID=318479 RepID=A0A0N4UJP2_DRAME